MQVPWNCPIVTLSLFYLPHQVPHTSSRSMLSSASYSLCSEIIAPYVLPENWVPGGTHVQFRRISTGALLAQRFFHYLGIDNS